MGKIDTSGMAPASIEGVTGERTDKVLKTVESPKTTAELAKEKSIERLDAVVGFPGKQWKRITGAVSRTVGGLYNRAKETALGLVSYVVAPDVYAGAARDKALGVAGDMARTLEQNAPTIQAGVEKAAADVGDEITKKRKLLEDGVSDFVKTVDTVTNDISDIALEKIFTLKMDRDALLQGFRDLKKQAGDSLSATFDEVAKAYVEATNKIDKEIMGALGKVNARRLKVQSAVEKGFEWCISPSAWVKTAKRGIESVTGVAEIRKKLEEEGRQKTQLLKELEAIKAVLATQREAQAA